MGGFHNHYRRTPSSCMLFANCVRAGLQGTRFGRNSNSQPMPTYIYETATEPILQFEVKQSMNDEPLTVHPETGVPVRRVISGGYGILQKAGKAPAKPRGHGCCGGCGCGHAH